MSESSDGTSSVNGALLGPVVTKAVIPAAGLGTRFLPATKATPKEMLPVVDKPSIQYVVEEAVAAQGIGVVLISSELPEIMGMTDRVAVFHGGRVSAVETTGGRIAAVRVSRAGFPLHARPPGS